LAYVTSFLFIANFWVGTLMILRHLRRFDGRLLWIVLVHMLLIAFIPYPTSVIGQHPNDQVAQVFYFATLSATALLLALLWWYASGRRRLVDVDISQKVVVELHRNSIAATALFLVLTGLSVVGVGRIVSGLLLGYVVAALSILMAVVVNVGDDADREKPLPDSQVETRAVGEARQDAGRPDDDPSP
jgi:uncharacterized membrane protein